MRARKSTLISIPAPPVSSMCTEREEASSFPLGSFCANRAHLFSSIFSCLLFNREGV